MSCDIIQMRENTWRIEDGGVRFFLLAGTEKALLIDSGMNVDNAREIAAGLTALPVSLLNTHADRDHIGSNQQFDAFYMHCVLEEIRALLASGVPAKATSMQAIGYKEFVSALAGEGTLEEAAQQVQQSSRHYAKRQLTWFRRNKAIHWLRRAAGAGTEEILSAARQVLEESDN